MRLLRRKQLIWLPTLLQLSEDDHWSQYDKSYCDWAAAKGVPRWGNVYGHFLATKQGQLTIPIIFSKWKVESGITAANHPACLPTDVVFVVDPTG